MPEWKAGPEASNEGKKTFLCHKAKASANVMVTVRVPINNFLSLETETDWVVWCRVGDESWESRPTTVRGVEIFNSKEVEEKHCKRMRSLRDDEEESEEDVPKLIGKGCKRRGWWKEGRVGRTKGQNHMACWVHVRDNGEAVHARSIRELEREWLQKDDMDDLGLDVTGLERDYWLGTEAGLLG